MGSYTNYSIYAKHRNGALLSKEELTELDSHLMERELRCETVPFSIEERTGYGHFFGTYEGTSFHDNDDMAYALAAFAQAHEDLVIQVFIDYDDGEGEQMLFSGNEKEVLQKIISYEEAQKIIWD